MVCVPSSNGWISNPEKYHQVGPKRPPVCQQTYLAHKHNANTVSKDPGLQSTWYAFIFPEGTVLDSHIFLRSHKEVEKEKRRPKDETAQSTELRSIAVKWVIAIKGTERQIEEATTNNDNNNKKTGSGIKDIIDSHPLSPLLLMQAELATAVLCLVQ